MQIRSPFLRRWIRRVTGDRRATPPMDPELPKDLAERTANHKVRAMIDLGSAVDLDALKKCSRSLFDEYVRKRGKPEET